MGLAERHPGPLTPCAEPPAPSTPAMAQASCAERAPHTKVNRVGAGRSHLAGALQSSGLVTQSGLAPGGSGSQTVSLSAVPAGGTMLSGLAPRSPKTPGIWKTQRPSGVCTCPASIAPWYEAPQFSLGNHSSQTQYLLQGAGTD